jgi:glycosyltransferase involved in cell wall biosynthesis
VLYLIDSLGPGGAQRQLATLLGSLDKEPIEPEVAIYYPFYHFRDAIMRQGIPLHMIGPGGGRNPVVLARLAQLMSRGGYDLVHTYLRTPGVLARVASMFSGNTPVVVSERSTGLDQNAWRLTLERLLASRASAFVVNSEAMAEEVQTLLPRLAGRLFVVPNGVLWNEPTSGDIERAASFRERHLGDADLLLLALSRLSREKGPDVLADALLRIASGTLARLRVLWMGACVDRKLYGQLRSFIADRLPHDSVVFLPPTTDTTSALLASDALILPSRREGLPNSVLEALAQGRPVIASDVGDTGQVLAQADAGWIVTPEDPDALARAVEAFAATGSERLRAMGARGSDLVRREYSTERLAERTISVYESVMSRKGKGRTEARK